MRIPIYKFVNNTLARALKTPPYLILFVSDRCTNNCRHCWYSKEWKKDNLSKNELTNDELIRISENLEKVNFLSITGGEAFLRDGIEEIVMAFARNTKVGRFDIPTSGFNPDLIVSKAEKILKFLKDKPLRIDISLDGTENTHNYIRQNQSAFVNARATIEALKKLRRQYGNLDLSIITTISEYNFREINSIAELAESWLPDGEWMINIVRGNEPGQMVKDEVLNAYIAAGRIVTKRISGGGYSGDKAHKLGKWLTAKNIVRRDIISDVLNNKRKGGGCAAGSLAGVIFNDGDVRPCETLPLSFGNLRDYDYSLDRVWNNEKAKNIRSLIQETNCKCTHECFLSVSMLIQPSCILKMFSQRYFV